MSVIFLLMASVFINVSSQEKINILNNIYDVFIIDETSYATGVSYKKLSVPDFPLEIYVVEADASNTSVSIEAWKGGNSLSGRNTPLAAAQNNSTENHQVIAAINGGFYDMSGELAGVPNNGHISRGNIMKTPTSAPSIAFDTQNKPVMGEIAFSGTVIAPDMTACAISAVNCPRYADQLIIYNHFYGNATRTNEYGTEVLLTPTSQNNYLLSSRNSQKYKVDKIEKGAGKMQIPQGSLVLSGHGSSANFLNNLAVGNELSINFITHSKSNPGFIKFESEILQINDINNPRWADMLAFYNNARNPNQSPAVNEYGRELLISPVGNSWDSGKIICKVESVTELGTPAIKDIPEGMAILSGHGTARIFLEKIQVGDIIDVHIPHIQNMIGGHLVVLNNGEPAPATTNPSDVGTARHPRTAVGFSADSLQTYFIVIDGRNENSAGVTSRELADVATYLGCYNAINLDGGGSSCIVAGNSIKNNYSDSAPRSVSDGLLIAFIHEQSSISPQNKALSNIDILPVVSGSKISFIITCSEQVNDLRLEFFDIQGNKLYDLYQKSIAQGKHSIETTINAQTAKVYLYKITTGDKTDSGKFTFR